MIVPDEPAGPSATTDEPNEKANEVLLQQLVDMGFPVDGCKRALFKTGNNNAEAAMNWIFEHQSDPDFDTPYQSATASVSASAVSDSFNVQVFRSSSILDGRRKRCFGHVDGFLAFACSSCIDDDEQQRRSSR